LTFGTSHSLLTRLPSTTSAPVALGCCFLFGNNKKKKKKVNKKQRNNERVSPSTPPTFPFLILFYLILPTTAVAQTQLNVKKLWNSLDLKKGRSPLCATPVRKRVWLWKLDWEICRRIRLLKLTPT
jgi:hypothetical protein